MDANLTKSIYFRGFLLAVLLIVLVVTWDTQRGECCL